MDNNIWYSVDKKEKKEKKNETKKFSDVLTEIFNLMEEMMRDVEC